MQLMDIFYWFVNHYKNFNMTGDFSCWAPIVFKNVDFFNQSCLGALFYIGISLLFIYFIFRYIISRYNNSSSRSKEYSTLFIYWVSINITVYLILTQFVNWSHAIIIFPLLAIAAASFRIYYLLIFVYLVAVITRWMPSFSNFELGIDFNSFWPWHGILYSLLLFFVLRDLMQKAFYHINNVNHPKVNNIPILPLVYANFLLFFTRQHIIDFFTKILTTPDYFLLIVFCCIFALLMKIVLQQSTQDIH